MLRLLLLGLMTSLLLACSMPERVMTMTHFKQAPAKPKPKPVVQRKNMPNFTCMNLIGRMDVTLHTGAKRSQLVLHGVAGDLDKLKISVVNGVLRIERHASDKDAAYPISVDIYTNHLENFRYQGRGKIEGRNLKTTQLKMAIDNKNETNLSGKLGMKELVIRDGKTKIEGVISDQLKIALFGTAHLAIKGQADIASVRSEQTTWLTAHWVKSSSLSIHANGQAYIQLAGLVHRLDVETWNKARFNGRYLRADDAFVRTHNQSVVEMATVDKQHTLASDGSNIYYYNEPRMQTDFMAFNGSVLDMDVGAKSGRSYKR